MATFVPFQPFLAAAMNGKHNLSTATLFVQFLNTSPAVTNAVETDLPADLATGGGYTTGGMSVGVPTSSSQSAGVYKLILPDYTFTATGAVGPFRYVALFNNSATNKDLIGYYDYGAAGVTLANTETFTADWDQVNGVFSGAFA